MANAKILFDRRKRRVRNKISKNALLRPRLSVFRSGMHIYAQVIDDVKGVTIAAASTVEKDLRASKENSAGVGGAGEVGKLIAERAKKAGIEQVIFDRGGYRYHGRVKALAEAARETGLKF
jgi:large subunit ribosomal protein L18